MLACAKLLLAGVLAFSPLVEFFDTWEQPWNGESEGELVLTVLSAAVALGYACLRRTSALLRNLLLRTLHTSSSLRAIFARQQRSPRVPLTCGLSPPPLRI